MKKVDVDCKMRWLCIALYDSRAGTVHYFSLSGKIFNMNFFFHAAAPYF
jgi:hypothetical protein